MVLQLYLLFLPRPIGFPQMGLPRSTFLIPRRLGLTILSLGLLSLSLLSLLTSTLPKVKKYVIRENAKVAEDWWNPKLPSRC